jgi:hypothetical protein
MCNNKLISPVQVSVRSGSKVWMHKKRLLDQHTRAVRLSICSQRHTSSKLSEPVRGLYQEYPGETSKQDEDEWMTTSKGNKVKSHKH